MNLTNYNTDTTMPVIGIFVKGNIMKSHLVEIINDGLVVNRVRALRKDGELSEVDHAKDAELQSLISDIYPDTATPSEISILLSQKAPECEVSLRMTRPFNVVALDDRTPDPMGDIANILKCTQYKYGPYARMANGNPFGIEVISTNPAESTVNGLLAEPYADFPNKSELSIGVYLSTHGSRMIVLHNGSPV